ncbi:MAG: hypothetical protein Kow006_08680 [Gammaproteobacteria bacterium]
MALASVMKVPASDTSGDVKQEVSGKWVIIQESLEQDRHRGRIGVSLDILLAMLPPVLFIYTFVYAAAYVAFSAAQLEKKTKSQIHTIIAPETPAPSERISLAALDSVPAPVAAYLRQALTEGHEAPHRIRISQDGYLRLKNEEKAWRPFSARQYIQTGDPAFVWDARIDLFPPIVDARAVDSYRDGRAGMCVRLMSALPLVNESDKPELIQGTLTRYLAEAVWCPTILLPGERLQWEEIDATSARAILTDHDYRVALVFRFNERHEVIEVESESRFREVNGDYVATPWRGLFKEYAQRGDMRIPLRAAAQWCLPGGEFTYWRGRIRSIEYDPQPSVWE